MHFAIGRRWPRVLIAAGFVFALAIDSGQVPNINFNGDPAAGSCGTTTTTTVPVTTTTVPATTTTTDGPIAPSTTSGGGLVAHPKARASATTPTTHPRPTTTIKPPPPNTTPRTAPPATTPRTTPPKTTPPQTLPPGPKTPPSVTLPARTAPSASAALNTALAAHTAILPDVPTTKCNPCLPATTTTSTTDDALAAKPIVADAIAYRYDLTAGPGPLDAVGARPGKARPPHVPSACRPQPHPGPATTTTTTTTTLPATTVATVPTTKKPPAPVGHPVIPGGTVTVPPPASTTTTATTTPPPVTTAPTTPSGTIPGAALNLDRNSLPPGGVVIASGHGCVANSSVQLLIDGTPAGTAVAGADGTFRAPLTASVAVGPHTVTALCGPTLVATLDVVLTSQAGIPTATAAILLLVLLLLLVVSRWALSDR